MAWLSPRALTWDGIAFLAGAREGTIDYGHALYLPALRGALWLAGGSDDPERVARCFSALGGAGALLLLWRRAERAGASTMHAFGAAALFALATLVWQEAGSIEPSSWTIVALLAAEELARSYALDRSWRRLCGLVAAFGAAVGFHLVSLCALPWLVALARHGRRPVPRAQLYAPLGAAALALGAAVTSGELGRYLRYWSGFVPSYAAGLETELLRHLARGGRLLLEGAPVLLLAGVVAASVLARSRPRALADAAWLAGPYLLAFLVLGKPLVGLWLPVLLACALLAGGAVGAVRSRACGLVLGLALGVELALVVPQALQWKGAPDVDRARAELVVRYLPEGALLFAGKLANHLRYYHPGVEVVSLPELWHDAFARDRSADPIEVVQRAVDAAQRRCVLSSDGAVFLRDIPADPARLGLTLERAFLVPEDPRLLLFPLDARSP